MEDCIFCKIAQGEIPSTTVYEDGNFKAILDVSPAARGHVLIVAKGHYANVFELPDDVAAKVMPVAKKVAAAVKKAFDCDGINILQNNGEVAGQTQFHFHVHIIPRHKGDTIDIEWKHGELSDDREAIADAIRKELLATTAK